VLTARKIPAADYLSPIFITATMILSISGAEMNFRFADNRLRRAYERHAVAFREWGAIAGEAYIARIGQIKRAANLDDLHAGPGKFEPLTGDRKGQYSFRLTKGRRLIVTLEDDGQTVVVQEVSDHYE
jgi:plasmid maintenance system killer protein